MKKYKQRVFLQYFLITYLTIVASLFVSMNNGRNIEIKMTGVFFILVGILYIITQTKYIIEGDKLLLKIGKITETTININNKNAIIIRCLNLIRLLGSQSKGFFRDYANLIFCTLKLLCPFFLAWLIFQQGPH